MFVLLSQSISKYLVTFRKLSFSFFGMFHFGWYFWLFGPFSVVRFNVVASRAHTSSVFCIRIVCIRLCNLSCGPKAMLKSLQKWNETRIPKTKDVSSAIPYKVKKKILGVHTHTHTVKTKLITIELPSAVTLEKWSTSDILM